MINTDEFSGRHASTQHLLRQFNFDHLPPELHETSGSCANLAVRTVRTLADGPELSAGLRHLLEAKDCFVRAKVEQLGLDG